MQAADRFTSESMLKLRREIEDAGGNEVFALGRCNEQGLVAEFYVSARGNEESVPALQLDPAPGSEASGYDVFIHNHPSGPLTPSGNDLGIASRMALHGIGAYIVDNSVSRVYVAAEPVKKRRRKILDPDEIAAALEESGAVSRRLTGYERRDAQLDLVRLITRAFNEDAIAAAEAGTGVGKSFAYLLPALEYALANEERIVISTATITLQQQLFDKDIPLVLSALGKTCKCALVKGRGNYLCRRRLTEALLEPPLDEGEYGELASIAKWAEQTGTGSRSDLSFLPAVPLWQSICCEADTCLGMRCAERERCFFMVLRRESSDARILVVNHHLLFADLAARFEGAGYDTAVVLPPYTRVIIDEAHTIEAAATSFFSRSCSRPGINRALSRLYRKRRTLESGLLLRLAALLPALPQSGTETAAGQAAGKSAGKKGRSTAVFASRILSPGMIKALTAVREAAEKADAAALAHCGAEGQFRLIPERAAGMEFLFSSLETMRRAVTALVEQIRSMTELAGEDDPVVWEIRAVLRRLESAAAICTAFLECRPGPAAGKPAKERPRGIGGSPETEEVYWIERRNGSDPWAVLNATPVDIAPLLRDALFSANKTVVCVSATLAQAGGLAVQRGSRDTAETGGTSAGAFRFWAERTGAVLADREPLYGVFPSPFPYAEQTLLTIPAGCPLPDTADYEDFTNRALTDLIGLAGGGALVLFTSYYSLQRAFEAVSPVLGEQGIRCLKQGDDDRSRLLAEFVADTASVLFGTDSFWEGVDAPGETLRMVVICRLPFRTLRDPVFEARRERLERQGRSSFEELSLPDAVIKFKQGFGRLMRRAGDYGVVAVLDGRILCKQYGAAFLQSLPETKTSFREMDALLRDVERFLY